LPSGGTASTGSPSGATPGDGSPSPTPAATQGNVNGTYVSPQFFGQHLMFYSALNPAIPVHAMRLWDSNTQWCQMDNGTASNQYDFGQLDALLGQAPRLGADVEFTFGNTPRWASSGAYPEASATGQCSSSFGNTAPANE